MRCVYRAAWGIVAGLALAAQGGSEAGVAAELRAGAAVVDVTPVEFPVLVNGGMLSRSVSTVKTPLNARALVVDDGTERAAIVVVDSCMIGRPLLDEAKALAAKRTRIKADHMLISATHTHSAGSSMGCLGTDADPRYSPFLRDKLVEAIVAAEKNLEPARVGWGSIDAPEHTAVRQWIRRPDRLAEDPFGNFTLRANMHAGRNWEEAVGEAGPEDPQLSLISFQAKTGRPICVLANFSMHYFGDAALSADYFGLFSEGLKARLAKGKGSGPAFVGMMSHGCSGDIWRADYMKPAGERNEKQTIEDYTTSLLDLAEKAYKRIEYADGVPLRMAEARMTLKYRTPNKQLLEWSQRIVKEMGERPAKTNTEVYAREQIILDERKETEIVVQGLRIGGIGIATTPNETYALSGLKIKLQSPLEKTMVIELANGGDGYIPPPEQHPLGGYNTWPARSAGLETQAEPMIVEAGLTLLERVADKPRRPYKQTRGSATEATLALKPIAYYRLDEFAAPRAADSAGTHDAIYESGVLFFLEGPRSQRFCTDGETNRAAHFVGGRLNARLPMLGERYTVSLWVWNGLVDGARDPAGWLVSRGRDHALRSEGDTLGVAGGAEQGKLVFTTGGEGKKVVGRTPIKRWTWTHVALVRDGEQVNVYLDGASEPEITATLPAGTLIDPEQWFFGGRCDRQATWEGRLDEIAVFDRALSADEVGKLSGAN